MVNLQLLVAHFENHIMGHDKVAICNRLASRNDDEYIYEILRTSDLPLLRVYISGAYEYDSGAYAARPKEIKAGDFILLDKFAPGADRSIIETARRDRIAIGPWSKLYGALNSHEPWKYRAPDERGK